MEIEPDVKKQLENIASGMECPKDFECRTLGPEGLCKAKRSGLKANNLVECLDENKTRCRFSLSFGKSYFCKCPLRIFLTKIFDK